MNTYEVVTDGNMIEVKADCFSSPHSTSGNAVFAVGCNSIEDVKKLSQVVAVFARWDCILVKSQPSAMKG
jgi:hypothetical protein